jgi:hypothetical protein
VALTAADAADAVALPRRARATGAGTSPPTHRAAETASTEAALVDAARGIANVPPNQQTMKRTARRRE